MEGSASDYLLMFGQSNCVGFTQGGAGLPFDTPNQKINIFTGERFEVLQWTKNNEAKDLGFGVEVPFAFYWDEPLAIVKHAKGSTQLGKIPHSTSWNINESSGLLETFITKTLAAFEIKRPKRVMLYMNQWEEDAEEEQDSLDYLTNLTNIMYHLESRLGVAIDAIVLTEANRNIASLSDPFTLNIRTAQESWVSSEGSRAALIDQETFVTPTETVDGVHLDPPTMVRLGEKVVSAFKTILNS